MVQISLLLGAGELEIGCGEWGRLEGGEVRFVVLFFFFLLINFLMMILIILIMARKGFDVIDDEVGCFVFFYHGFVECGG